ncbi:GPR1/FUN34/YaaH family transporter, partial [Streptomyces sp. NPDC044571]|uniref:GPR1/FUN34/YaaH family transporter n=1 Tax=Streptomyces sp. NPDC044571 TaxID=3155371 RepID=UPI0033FF5C0E
MSDQVHRVPDRDDVVATVQLRALGTPLPLGFIGLAAGAFVLSGLQLDWIAFWEAKVVALVLVAFVFPTQLFAAVLGFRCRDSVAGTAMAVLAATWLATGSILGAGPPGGVSKALGLLLLVSGVALLIPVGAGGRSRVVVSAVLGLAALRFLLTGVYELSGVHGWEVAAGVTGLVSAALAFYAALAFAVEDAHGRAVLPLGRAGGRLPVGPRGPGGVGA